MNLIDGSTVQTDQVKKGTSSDKGFEITVNTLSNKSIKIWVYSENYIQTVKKKICDIEGIPTDQQRLMFYSRQLEDGRTLSDYNIVSSCTLILILKLTGGGMPFADISEKGTHFKWNRRAPKRRMAREGLCLEGKCENEECEAYNQMVVINMGDVCTFRLGLNHTRPETNCPICDEHVKPVTCGFNNCQYRYISIKETKDSTVYEKSNWKEVGDTYLRFNEKRQ